MSHNYPYRRPPSDTDLRPDPGSYRSVDYRHSSADRDFYRQPQDSFSTSASTSYTSSSSSRGSAPLQSSQEGVLNILSSCGLEPGDLALLAELPEDVLTVESLPHILRQIKCKKGTVKPFSSRAPSPPSSSFHPPSSTYRPATSSSSCSSRDWDQLNRPSVQYPLDHLPPPHPPSEQLLDRWGNPITVSSSRTAPLPSSSSSSSSSLGYTVDFHRRQGPSDYGKTGPVPSYSLGRREGAPPSRFSEAGPADYRAAAAAPPPSNEYKSKSHTSRRDPSSMRSSQSSASMPTRKEALDFHGKVPPVFPYSCSLCDITVLSQKVWIQHVSGTQHADGQLSLLQQFPNWDCRMQTICRDDKSEKKKKDGGRAASAANQTASQSNRNSKQKKTLEKGKVVCVKFPSQSVDETYLRKLTEPFGKIVKILMFPSLGFVEMGSVDQAKDLVKFHSNYPPTVNGEQIEFGISNAFNFLQSSRVVNFTPAPSGEHGKSDLISIVKRFGPPLYTLFLPSMAFVEMKNAPDAQKLVDYYQSNTLRLNDDLISVSFSGEYKTLMRVSKAKRYEEENEGTKKSSTKRTRSSSRDRDKSKENKKRRSRSRSRSKDKSKEKSSSEAKTTSRSQEMSDRKRKSRTRSRSKDKSNSEKWTRTRSKSGSRDRTKEKSTRESKTKSQEKKSGSRSRSRDKSREKSNKDQKIRSTSRDNSSKESKTRSTTSKERKSRSRSRSMDKSSRGQKSRPRQRSTSMSSRQDGEKTADPEKPESSSKDEPAPLEDSKPDVLDKQQVEEEAALPGEESDIEGMEVIAEDGENLKDEDVEALQEEEKIMSPAEIAPEKDEAEEVTGGEPDNQENPVTEEGEEGEESREATETQEESEDFPVDLENCITLDELGEDESDDQEGESADEPKSTSRSSRVFYFCHLPAHYALFDFFKLLRNFGRVVRYYLIGNRREGFIEMSSSSAALKAVEELTSNPAIHNCPKLLARISAKYYRLDNGWVVHSDGSDDEKNRSSSKKNEKQSKSKLLDCDESDRKSKGRKESLKKTSEKEAASKKTPEREPLGKKTSKKEKDPKNTLENKSSGRKTPDKESPSKKTSDKDSASESKKTSKKELLDEQTPEKESADRLTPEKGPSYDKIPENEAVEAKGTPENNSVPLTTLKTEPEEENIQQNEELVAAEGPEEEKTKGPAEDHFRKKTPKAEKQEEQETSMEVCAEAGPDVEDTERPNPPDTSTDPPKAQPEQEVEPQPAPAEGATEPQKPTKPVGTEFVRPVVGYFCNLCQLIFADEDEAKQQHCSSPTHYSKYQEKTGNDPWTS